ncbi:cyclase family protein [bacterium]|nr:cyclase family protein [bacterium]
MKVIDISQEIFASRVYPGDPSPKRTALESMAEGSTYNLSAFSMCAHNGTHIDAPRHFLPEGKTIDQLEPSIFVGPAYVATVSTEEISAAQAERIIAAAAQAGAGERLLLRGSALVTPSSARVFAQAKLKLIGTDLLSFGPEETPAEVHRILLSSGIALLEGLSLDHVSDGYYMLSAMPLNLGGCEGSPCRAVLIEDVH